MTEKEEVVLKEIINYYKTNKTMPTYRYLLKTLGFKSLNSIAQYLKSLEKKSYLIKNNHGKLVLNSCIQNNSNSKRIQVINCKNQFISLILNKKKNYLAYQIKNNYFKDFGIIKDDYLIIELKKKLHDNDLGLFIIDNKYQVLQHQYKDGFYILKSNQEIILHRINLIGKVIYIERKIKTLKY